MIRIQEYQPGFAAFKWAQRAVDIDAEDRRLEAYRLFSPERYQIMVDLVENSLESLVNLGALAAAREELQILADLGCEVSRWERRIADAERKTA